MELYLIRHGQSTNNALPDEPIEGVTRAHDPALTELGKAQAEHLAAWFKRGDLRIPWTNPATGYTPGFVDAPTPPVFDHLYCSPMYRALQTAQPLAAALGVQPEVWIDIHEHGGIYLEQPDGIIGHPGMSRTQMLSEFPDYTLPEPITDQGWWRVADGHEERGAFYGRAIRVALELRQRAENTADSSHDSDERIAIITHGTFMDALLKALFNMLPTRSMFFLHYNTAITRIDFSARGLLVRCINRIDHLPAELIS